MVYSTETHGANERLVFRIIRESDKPLTLPEISERSGLPLSTAEWQVKKLENCGAVRKNGRCRRFIRYESAIGETDPDEFFAEQTAGEIWPEEVAAAKKKVKPGDRIRVLDYNAKDPFTGSMGAPIFAAVVCKYRHLVTLDNGHSVTYAELAKYYRDKSRYRCVR